MKHPTLPPRPATAWHQRRMAGLTLLEIVITLAIAMIGTAVGIPSYQHFIRQHELDASRHLLTSHFASARLTAVTHRRIVAVCPTDGLQTVCRKDGDWGTGWMMFMDPDGDRQPNGARDILRHEQPRPSPSLRIFSSRGRPQIRYLPDGRSAGSNLTVSFCRQRLLQAEVTVNNNGRIRSRRASGGACPP